MITNFDLLEFIDNATEHLQEIELDLLELYPNQTPELLNKILGHIQSLSLASQMLGLNGIYLFSFRMQQSITNIRDYQIQVSENIQLLLFKIYDRLKLLIQELENSASITKKYEDQIFTESEPIFQSLNYYIKSLNNPLENFGFLEEVFPLKNAVNNAADYYNKQAKVQLLGRDTPIKQSVLYHFAQKILPPLINNAVAHGIELPEDRQKAGKSMVGTININGLLKDNQTVIIFSDDGAGINPVIVTEKAINKGLISRERANSLSINQIYKLIYLPDFSTKDERDLRAGLGFGMDIIRTELKKIDGQIKTDSILGKGTTFTIIYS